MDFSKATRRGSSPLSTAFFALPNIDRIQAAIIERVAAQTSFRLRRQSDDDLVAAMNHIFNTYAADMYAAGNALESETQRLNGLVVGLVVPEIINAMKMRATYLRDAGRLPDPMPRPLASSIKGEKSLAFFQPS